MTRWRVFLATLAAFPLMAAAPAPLPLSPPSGLGELVLRALRANPAVSSAEASEDAAIRSRTDSLFGFAPRASWLFDNSNERLNVKRSNNSVSRVGISNFANYGDTLQIVQPLFDPRVFAQLHGATQSLRRSRAELAAVRQRAVFEVIQAYLITLGSADALGVSRSEEASLARQQEQLGIKVRNGVAAASDLDEVTSRLSQTRAQREGAESSLAQVFISLERRSAGKIVALRPLAGPISMPPPEPADAEEWVRIARLRNPEVQALEGAAGEALATFEAQSAALLPRVDLTYTQNRAQTGGSVYGGGSLITDRTLLFRLTVPLFNADGSGYPAYASHSRYRSARYRTEDQRADVEERTRIAYEETVGNVVREREIAKAVAAQERVLLARRQKFNAGLMRIVDVLEAERDFYQVQRLLLASRYNYLLNLMQLKRLAGDISEADAAFIDASLKNQGATVLRTGLSGE